MQETTLICLKKNNAPGNLTIYFRMSFEEAMATAREYPIALTPAAVSYDGARALLDVLKQYLPAETWEQVLIMAMTEYATLRSSELRI